MRDAALDDSALQWALDALAGDRLLSVTSLREGGSPWLLHWEGSKTTGSAVLRMSDPEMVERQGREARGLALAHAGGIPVPNVVATRVDARRALLLMEYADGSSHQPVDPDPARLQALGAIAARISATELGDPPLPEVTHPIPTTDFDELRARTRPQPLLVAAQARVAEIATYDPIGFVHGDLWSGNTLWRGRELVGVIDWECVGIGAAGDDLGSLRCDAAMCYGLEAAQQVLIGWQREAGALAESIAYWDAVAALSTPPDLDLGWFPAAIIGMTDRPDLTKELLRERRDSFLANTLERLPR